MNRSVPVTLAEALRQSDLLHDRATIERTIATMAARIDAALVGERPVFLTVMHGAMLFASQLAFAMQTDLEFDYIHATRYRGATSGSNLHWLREPTVSLKDRTVVLVDDILDEGYTLQVVRDDCLRRGARRVLVVTLCTKQHDRRVEGIEADFNGLMLPDRYVFGYGMDFKEQGRNLPAIYVLR